jgi:hypothetical protein
LIERRLTERPSAPVAEPSDAVGRPALLDRQGLARELGVSLASLDRLRAEPGFPELRLGDVPRFELVQVVAWVHGRQQKGLRVVK